MSSDGGFKESSRHYKIGLKINQFYTIEETKIDLFYFFSTLLANTFLKLKRQRQFNIIIYRIENVEKRYINRLHHLFQNIWMKILGRWYSTVQLILIVCMEVLSDWRLILIEIIRPIQILVSSILTYAKIQHSFFRQQTQRISKNSKKPIQVSQRQKWRQVKGKFKLKICFTVNLHHLRRNYIYFFSKGGFRQIFKTLSLLLLLFNNKNFFRQFLNAIIQKISCQIEISNKMHLKNNILLRALSLKSPLSTTSILQINQFETLHSDYKELESQRTTKSIEQTKHQSFLRYIKEIQQQFLQDFIRKTTFKQKSKLHRSQLIFNERIRHETQSRAEQEYQQKSQIEDYQKKPFFLQKNQQSVSTGTEAYKSDHLTTNNRQHDFNCMHMQVAQQIQSSSSKLAKVQMTKLDQATNSQTKPIECGRNQSQEYNESQQQRWNQSFHEEVITNQIYHQNQINHLLKAKQEQQLSLIQQKPIKKYTLRDYTRCLGVIRCQWYDKRGKLELVAFSTAFAISRWLVLTSGHSVFDKKRNRACDKIYFIPFCGATRYSTKDDVYESKDEDFLRYQPLQEHQRYGVRPLKKDYAVFILQRPFINECYFELSTQKLVKGQTLHIFGFPCKQYDATTQNVGTYFKRMDLRGQFQKIKQKYILVHNLDTQGGHSGSPILRIQEKGNELSVKVVGIHTHRGQESTNEGLVMTKQLKQKIQKFCAQLQNRHKIYDWAEQYQRKVKLSAENKFYYNYILKE